MSDLHKCNICYMWHTKVNNSEKNAQIKVYEGLPDEFVSHCIFCSINTNSWFLQNPICSRCKNIIKNVLEQ